MLGSLEAVAYHATRNLVLNKATKISCRIKTHDSAHRQLNTEPLTLRRLMSYIYMEHPFLMFLDHTQRRSTVGRTPLDE